ncbi:hypothetical protein [Asticcacaulis machinosus]|uniref:Uncharacterized protein n=1 Tax=Asticcacaulis machinosus TaxID=2984211 RepID=A0ABT5HJ12_9CAUL|nr:hypothetical protein [Asticcacaulis machinosus]MDC7676231.1 hypothetical protein [Asticcacaulis machinosus]
MSSAEAEELRLPQPIKAVWLALDEIENGPYVFKNLRDVIKVNVVKLRDDLISWLDQNHENNNEAIPPIAKLLEPDQLRS